PAVRSRLTHSLTVLRWRLLDGDRVDNEDECLVGSDRAVALRTVPFLRRHDQYSPGALVHPDEAFVPAFDDVGVAEVLHLHRTAGVEVTVDDFTVRPGHQLVTYLHVAAGGGFGAITFGQVPLLQCLGGGAVLWDPHRRLTTVGTRGVDVLGLACRFVAGFFGRFVCCVVLAQCHGVRGIRQRSGLLLCSRRLVGWLLVRGRTRPDRDGGGDTEHGYTEALVHGPKFIRRASHH